jgi:hypothetical protein
MPEAQNTDYIRVKFLPRGGSDYPWWRQLPEPGNRWGRCEFLFDPAERDYHWLVVYDELPARPGQRFATATETLSCPQAQTLLITGEPASVRIYGTGYLSQYGRVLTSQEPDIIRHPGAIFSQPGLRWYYGVGGDSLKTYDTMQREGIPRKTRVFSTVCSNKRQRHTLHSQRYRFTQRLQQEVPELDRFGHGVRPLQDKAEALDAYRYHLAIENHIAPHHLTEKLTDAFLGGALPFYIGCPNAADYFPAESFIPLDLYDYPAAVARIRQALDADEYTRRLPAILEARRRVLEEHNLFAVLARIIQAAGPLQSGTGGLIRSRRAYWRHHPTDRLAGLAVKGRLRLSGWWHTFNRA